LESVTFVESGGTTVYGRNGTIRRVSCSAPALPTTHSLNFSSLDFAIVSAIGFQRRYYRGATPPAVDLNNANPGANWSPTLGTGTDAVWEIMAAFNNGVFVPPWSAPVRINEEAGIPGLPGGGGVPVGGILAPRMRNISVRTVIPDNGVLIAGFVLDQPKSVIVRGISQSLAAFGVASGTLVPDPRIEIYSRDVVALINDNFSASVAGNATRATASARAAMTRVGAFPITSTRDAAVFTTLPAGAYTVHLKPADGRGGDCLIEVYDADL
jgi:hypothetical protein